MDSKSILASKTLWANLAMAALAFINAQWPTLDISAETMAAIIGAVNVIVRLFTKKPVTVP